MMGAVFGLVLRSAPGVAIALERFVRSLFTARGAGLTSAVLIRVVDDFSTVVDETERASGAAEDCGPVSLQSCLGPTP